MPLPLQTPPALEAPAPASAQQAELALLDAYDWDQALPAAPGLKGKAALDYRWLRLAASFDPKQGLPMHPFAAGAARAEAGVKVRQPLARALVYLPPGSPTPPPAGYQSTLTVAEWDALNVFAERHGLKVVFTLNDGPSSRDSAHQWNNNNAAALIKYTVQKGYPVSVWELGNEVNNFWFVFGPKNQISTAQYHQDLTRANPLQYRRYPVHQASALFAAYPRKTGKYPCVVCHPLKWCHKPKLLCFSYPSTFPRNDNK